jgi:hypothetical protein
MRCYRERTACNDQQHARLHHLLWHPLPTKYVSIKTFDEKRFYANIFVYVFDT